VSLFQINALKEEELNENFFKALSHVQEIHANCKVLLRTHHQVTFRSWVLVLATLSVVLVAECVHLIEAIGGIK